MSNILRILLAILIINSVTAQKPSSSTTWHVQFTPDNVTTFMDTQMTAFVKISNIESTNLNAISFRFVSKDDHLAKVNQIVKGSEIDPKTKMWSGNISVDVIFMGSTCIYVQKIDNLRNTTEINEDECLKMTIVRKKRVIDHVFTGSVILLVSLLYINFGAALDLDVLRNLVIKPVAPAICFLTQFVMMPLLGYAIGYFVFADNPELQLGLFFTGVSPSGGASNMWTVILGGNINLSVMMTTISNFVAFGMMPLWIFTLGRTIFERGDIKVPYGNVASIAFGLVIPLAIGLAIQRCSPRLARLLVRLLKPISSCLILFIIIFAIVTNFYIFQLFTWQIIIAGILLPWLGYAIAMTLGKTLQQNTADSLTIAIETGIQNTGITILLLQSLPAPQADLTTVVPVSVAIMTPFPLLGLYLYKRMTGRNIKTGTINEETHIVRP